MAVLAFLKFLITCKIIRGRIGTFKPHRPIITKQVSNNSLVDISHSFPFCSRIYPLPCNRSLKYTLIVVLGTAPLNCFGRGSPSTICVSLCWYTIPAFSYSVESDAVCYCRPSADCCRQSRSETSTNQPLLAIGRAIARSFTANSLLLRGDYRRSLPPQNHCSVGRHRFECY